ncbi:MAG TPA: nitroreductase family protein [Acidimicrobiia bacterium]
METWDAIRARRNVRTYDSRPIPQPELEQILEAGRRTPSSKNEQRWSFILIQDKDQLEKISHVWRGAGHISEATAAIAIAAPVSDDPRVNASINYDLGQLTMSMMIAAADLGVGTSHASVHDYELGGQILGLPEEWRLTWIIGLGYPGDRPLKPIRTPNRRPFTEVVHRERW